MGQHYYSRETGEPHVFMKEEPAKELRRLHRWMWAVLCIGAMVMGVVIGGAVFAGAFIPFESALFSFLAIPVLVITMFSISKREDT